ncbi:MAG: hypothetical protein HQL52_05415 [Magnetococcales bacterium]|nr:hypothetical protein [Magnetococcales bacterium]
MLLKLFKTFFKKPAPQKNTPKRQVSRLLWMKNNWRESPDQLVFLSKFNKPKTAKSIRKYWLDHFKTNPTKLLLHFESKNALEQIGLEATLSAALKVAELRKELQSRNLNSEGKKAELVIRLIEADQPKVKALTGEKAKYIMTAEANRHVSDYLENEKQKTLETENKIIALLSKHKYDVAIKTLIEFERQQIFQRSLGDGALDFYKNQGKEILHHIMKGHPKILKGLDKKTINILRAPAAMNFLFGTGHPNKWIPANLKLEFKFDADTAARMLHFHAKNKMDLSKLKEMNLKRVEWNGAGDSSCETCRQLDGKIFSIRSVPEIPHPECSSDYGCRCTYSIDSTEFLDR